MTSKCGSCLVCGHPAGSAHFGSTSCLACAAFFRRTVALNIKFICKQSRNCNVYHELRMVCRSCRFDKCISAGLTPSLVQKRRLKREPKSQPESGGEDWPEEELQTPVATVSRVPEPEQEVEKNSVHDEKPTIVNLELASVSEDVQPSCSQSCSFSPNPSLSFGSPGSRLNEESSNSRQLYDFPLVGMSGPELLTHYVKMLRRAMDRRCLMFSTDPIKAITGTCDCVPFQLDPTKAHTMKRQIESQQLDHLLALDFCQATPGYKTMTADEKLQFFRMSAVSFGMMDIAWITSQVAKPSDNLMIFTDGSVCSVTDLSVGWEDEGTLKAGDKHRLFFDFVNRLQSGLTKPLWDYGIDAVEYAALKAFCVWKMGYIEYTQSVRAMAKQHISALLIGLDAHYEDRPDKAERLGNMLLLMGTIFEIYMRILDSYQSIEVFRLLNMDNVSRQLLAL